jgi:hypothetical protein
LHQSGALLAFGALLCAFVVAIHVADQGGLTGMADPTYKGYLYYALEIGGALATLLLITRRAAIGGWVLALGVAVGPASGYILSRSIGLPGYSDDVGNWAEPLGVASLVVEGSLLICALVALIADHRVSAAELRAIGRDAKGVAEIPGPVRMDVTDAHDQMAQAVDAAQTETVLLERHGKPSAVMIRPARYDELMTAFELSQGQALLFGQVNTALDRRWPDGHRLHRTSPAAPR